MPSSISSSEAGRRSPWPWGLLIALALVGLGDQLLWSNARALGLLARYTPPGPDGDPLLSASALQGLAEERGSRRPLLLLGSSQVREGLDCAEIEQVLPGHACRNLAISAGSPLDMLYLQRRLDGLAPRRVVVLGLFPKVLHMAPKEAFVDGATLGCLLATDSWRRIGVRAWISVTFGLLERLSPTLRYKDALTSARKVVAGRWRAAWELRLPPQPERLLAGARPQPGGYYERLMGTRDADFPAVGPFTGSQERALERLIEGEARRGNLLLVVDFPTRPGYESTLPDEALVHWRRLCLRLAQRRDALFVPRSALPPLGEDDFLDFTHLGPSGRAQVSRRLAELVAQAEGAR